MAGCKPGSLNPVKAGPPPPPPGSFVFLWEWRLKQGSPRLCRGLPCFSQGPGRDSELQASLMAAMSPPSKPWPWLFPAPSYLARFMPNLEIKTKEINGRPYPYFAASPTKRGFTLGRLRGSF